MPHSHHSINYYYCIIHARTAVVISNSQAAINVFKINFSQKKLCAPAKVRCVVCSSPAYHSPRRVVVNYSDTKPYLRPAVSSIPHALWHACGTGDDMATSKESDRECISTTTTNNTAKKPVGCWLCCRMYGLCMDYDASHTLSWQFHRRHDVDAVIATHKTKVTKGALFHARRAFVILS